MCRCLSKSYLVLVNTLTALIGLALVGGSAYVLIQYHDIAAVLSKNATWAVLATGAVVFFTSILGCCAAKKQNKCGLFLYVAVLLAAVTGQLIGGAVIANYAGELKTDNGNINDLSQDVQDFVTCSQSWCCNGNGDTCGDKNVWASDGFCKVLPDSLREGSAACLADDETYNDEIVDFLHNHVKQFSVAAIVLASVQLLALFFALYLLCTQKKKEEVAQNLNQQQQAGTLVYGSHKGQSQNVNYAV